MNKIYSRPRIKLPKVFAYNIEKLSKNNKMLKFIVVIIIALLTVKLILDAILPIFDNICIDKAKSIATMISNEQATLIMKEHEYEELFTIEKNTQGDIVMIKSNVVPINQIISDIALKIQKSINEKGRENVGISLGSFTGIKIFAGQGPEIPIKISPVGNVETELKSEFISEGINQTLHRVYLKVDCKIVILTPYDSINQKISNQVLIAENVIVGNIPNTYYNFEGSDSSTALEIIE